MEQSLFQMGDTLSNGRCNVTRCASDQDETHLWPTCHPHPASCFYFHTQLSCIHTLIEEFLLRAEREKNIIISITVPVVNAKELLAHTASLSNFLPGAFCQ